MSWVEKVRPIVASVIDASIEWIREVDLEAEENLFVRAVVGRRGNVYARLERALVTSVGYHAPRFFQVFFTAVRPAREPFDFIGARRGVEYVVKVVTGPRAFNATMRRRIEEASLEVTRNPVILTLQGRGFEPQSVGKATWYSAPDSWAWVTGERGAYWRFRDLVFEEALKRRRIVQSLAEAAASQRRTAAGAPAP